MIVEHSNCLDTALARIDAVTEPDDWVTAATCRGLLIGYDRRWRNDQANIDVQSSEECHTAPLTNIDTGRDSRTYTIAGITDKLASDSDGLVLWDHKTTSSDISDPTSNYWRQLAVDSQASHYELLLLANGIRIDSIMWDVVRKPGIRPKKLAAKVKRELLESGKYCGFDVTQETIELLSNDEGRENGELYEYRLAEETISEPDKYFARRSNPRTREQLAEYAQELWGTAKLIREARNDNLHYRNSGACFNYGSPCEFLGLCAGVDDPHSENWQAKAKKSPELPDGIGGENVLTNSRLRCFQTCRRKHFYQYELGIERTDRERREALHFGSTWHLALDAYWSVFNERRENGYSNEQPTSSVGSQDQPQLA